MPVPTLPLADFGSAHNTSAIDVTRLLRENEVKSSSRSSGGTIGMETPPPFPRHSGSPTTSQVRDDLEEEPPLLDKVFRRLDQE